MRVVYGKPLLERITNLVNRARFEEREIEKIILSNSEFIRLGLETELPYEERRMCNTIFGIRIEVER